MVSFRFMENIIVATEGARAVQNGWNGKRVTVMGLGRFGGGVGVARWLMQQGAVVTVTDKEPAENLSESIAELLRGTDEVTQRGATLNEPGAQEQDAGNEPFAQAKEASNQSFARAKDGTAAGADKSVLRAAGRYDGDGSGRARTGRYLLRLGEHVEEDFRDADLVVVNPAVPPRSPYLKIAEEAGVPITTEINLFLECCPARCIGVTGTVGKSTTVAMIGHILSRVLGPERVWVGGNIGRSLLDVLPRIRPEHWVLLELSSFQLFRTAAIRWRPDIAAITNIAPNHLDWHESYEHYANSKLNLTRFQNRATDTLVISDQAEVRGQVIGAHGRDPENSACAWVCGVEGDDLHAIRQSATGDGGRTRLRWTDVRLRTPGAHNRRNAAMALTVAHAAGVEQGSAVEALRDFEALPHRLQLVGEADGVSYYDDSKSTTPESAITALAAFERPLIVLLGGYDKGADLTELCRLAAGRARFVACLGKTGADMCEKVRAAKGRAEYFERFDDAVQACRAAAKAGDAVLLSPACASWGMFTDYRERGKRFASLVGEWMQAGRR